MVEDARDDEVTVRNCALVDGALQINCRFKVEGALAELCDLETGACVEAAADCRAGWCLIPAATFVMGPAHENAARWGELPAHPVTITRPFVMQETEVTLEAWLATMGGTSPSRYDYPGDHPVSGMSFFDVVAYANRLSELEGRPSCYRMVGCRGSGTFDRDCDRVEFDGPACTGYRLPSEAEWELAAGLGLGQCHPDVPESPRDSVHFDGSCQAFVNIDFPLRYCHNAVVTYEGCINLTGIEGPACAGPGPVKEYPPNGFGLYGMGGNVHELTGTRFRWPFLIPPPPLELGYEVDPGHDTRPIDAAEIDPDGNFQGLVTRGGGYNHTALFTCVYSRQGLVPRGSSTFVGFRLVRTVTSAER